MEGHDVESILKNIVVLLQSHKELRPITVLHTKVLNSHSAGIGKIQTSVEQHTKTSQASLSAAMTAMEQAKEVITTAMTSITEELKTVNESLTPLQETISSYEAHYRMSERINEEIMQWLLKLMDAHQKQASELACREHKINLQPILDAVRDVATGFEGKRLCDSLPAPVKVVDAQTEGSSTPRTLERALPELYAKVARGESQPSDQSLISSRSPAGNVTQAMSSQGV